MRKILTFFILVSITIAFKMGTAQLLLSEPPVSPFQKDNFENLKSFNNGQILASRIAPNRLPLYFVRNEGQLPDHVKYYAINGKTFIYFTDDGIYFSVLESSTNTSFTKPSERKMARFENRKVNRKIMKMILVGASSRLLLSGTELQEARFHYFLGNDPDMWRKNVTVYAAVLYKNIYPGIDLKFYGNDLGELEYDFVVRPGSDPSRIRFKYDGARETKITPNGGISIDLRGTILEQRRPHVYQLIASQKIEVHGAYDVVTTAGNKGVVYGFDLDHYADNRTLFIDPIISFSTFLGGSDGEECLAIDRDSSGYLYVTGLTTSLDFPVTPGAYQTVSDDFSAFITKITPDGSSIVYSTYLGGSDIDSCSAIKVDETGAAYVGCHTASSDFPTVNPFQPNLIGYSDVAVAKLNPEGSSLVYSTYLGGSDSEDVLEIALRNHQVYAAGVTTSIDFPVRNPLQGTYGGGMYDGFVTVFNALGNDLIYSTYLGGEFTDYSFGIDTDSSGAAYVVGQTLSQNFPVTPGAFDTKCADGGTYCEDAYVSKIAPDGAILIYSTYLGGKKPDGAFAVAVNAAGSAYVTGQTSSPDFPTVNPAQLGLGPEAFVTKLTPDGSALVYSTYLGGRNYDWAYDIKVDSSGAAYVTGSTDAADFPKVWALPKGCPIYPYESSAFLTKVSPQGDSWEYSTCLGGSNNDSGSAIVVDNNGTVYVAGFTSSDDFPNWKALQPNMAGFRDGFITKILCDSISSPSVFEDSGPAVFFVHLCQSRSSDITINYSTSNGSALAGSDYVSTAGTVTIVAGNTEGSIEVPLLGDTQLEPEENFFLHLTSADIDLGEGLAEAKLLDSDALLYDNFEDDVMDWDVIKGEVWEQGGSLTAFGDKGATVFTPLPWIPSGVSGCGLCTIETRIALSSDGSGIPPKAILQAWHQNSGNVVELIMKLDQDKWVLKQRSAGHVVAKAKATAVIDPYLEYDVALKFDGTNFSLTVNGSNIITMKAAGVPYGKVGLKVKRSVGTLNYIRVF